MDIDEETIFNEALAIPDTLDREIFLNHACGANSRMRDRVVSLLTAYQSSSFLESTPPEITSFLKASDKTGLEGCELGPYEILDLLGEGGMGEVYLAIGKTGPRRPVALKVIKKGMDSQQILARFMLEQEVLKRLDHPHIAKLIDAGVSDTGRVFFAMELIQGIPITEYCDKEHLRLDRRIELFMDACRAIHHAHDRGIVHRDIKPTNVLIASEAGRPVVKVIDFGVAKALVDSLAIRRPHTRATQIIGTLGYMSPEQARWSSNVDARSDVYSLGALLYELLTGIVPAGRQSDAMDRIDELRHKGATDAIIWPSRRIAQLTPAEQERVCLSRDTARHQLIRQTRGELDWIVVKALEEQPEQRYATAGAFAEDLEAYLENRPTLAHPPSVFSRLRAWSRRNATVTQLVAIMISLTSVIVSLNLSTEMIRRARDGQIRSSVAFSEADFVRQRLQLDHDLQAAGSLVQSGDNQSAERLLMPYMQGDTQDLVNCFAFQYLRNQIQSPIHCLRGHQSDILDMDISPDRRWIASSDRGGEIIIWDRDEFREVQRLRPSVSEVTRVRFSPDGKQLATTGQSQVVDIWSVGTWKREYSLDGHEHTINGLAWAPDSKKLASGDRGGRVCIWDIESRSCDLQLPQHADVVRCMVWSPDGLQLAIAEGDDGVRVWDSRTWSQNLFVSTGGKGALAIAYSADSRFMAFGGYFNELVVVDSGTGAVLHRSETDSTIASLAFGPHNELILGGGLGYLQIFKHSTKDNTWDLVRVADIASSGNLLRSVATLEKENQILIASEQERMIKVLPSHSVLGFRCLVRSKTAIGFVPQMNCVLYADPDTASGNCDPR